MISALLSSSSLYPLNYTERCVICIVTSKAGQHNRLASHTFRIGRFVFIFLSILPEGNELCIKMYIGLACIFKKLSRSFLLLIHYSILVDHYEINKRMKKLVTVSACYLSQPTLDSALHSPTSPQFLPCSNTPAYGIHHLCLAILNIRHILTLPTLFVHIFCPFL
jgi:hypothetical protein